MLEKTYQYFEIEVSLLGVEPKIWRQFLIQRNSTFGDLHRAIQLACGWKNSHLYSFSERNPYHRHDEGNTTFAISPYDDAEGYEHEPQYADNLRLSHCFDASSIGHSIFYLYDYGDGWIHQVELVGFYQLEEKFRRQLLAGERAFPLEDSGALPGYQRCVDAFYSPEQAEEDLLHWMGNWDPEHFDLTKSKAKFNLPRSKSPSAVKTLGKNSGPAVDDRRAAYSNLIDITAQLARSKNDA